VKIWPPQVLGRAAAEGLFHSGYLCAPDSSGGAGFQKPSKTCADKHNCLEKRREKKLFFLLKPSLSVLFFENL